MDELLTSLSAPDYLWSAVLRDFASPRPSLALHAHALAREYGLSLETGSEIGVVSSIVARLLEKVERWEQEPSRYSPVRASGLGVVKSEMRFAVADIARGRWNQVSRTLGPEFLARRPSDVEADSGEDETDIAVSLRNAERLARSMRTHLAFAIREGHIAITRKQFEDVVYCYQVRTGLIEDAKIPPARSSAAARGRQQLSGFFQQLAPSFVAMTGDDCLTFMMDVAFALSRMRPEGLDSLLEWIGAFEPGFYAELEFCKSPKTRRPFRWDYWLYLAFIRQFEFGAIWFAVPANDGTWAEVAAFENPRLWNRAAMKRFPSQPERHGLGFGICTEHAAMEIQHSFDMRTPKGRYRITFNFDWAQNPEDERSPAEIMEMLRTAEAQAEG